MFGLNSPMGAGTAICVIGTGRRMQRLPPTLMKQMKLMGINVEVADTVNGLATFNVLNEEVLSGLVELIV